MSAISTATFLPASPLTSAAAEAAEAAARHAAASERKRNLQPEVADAIRRAGFARHFVPQRWGGAAGTFAELLDAVAAVGAHCTSAAWCAALAAAHGRLASYLPARGRDELWAPDGPGPDALIAAAVVPPAGEVAAEGDGWRLSGRWNYASGVDHADWVLLASMEGPRYRIFAVPRRELRIEDTWTSVGLRATGSNSVTADGLFVPGRRSFLRDALTGANGDADPARCHRVPYALVAALIFCAPALGAAEGALRSWTELTGRRRTAGGQPAAEDPAVRQVLARSSAEIEAARLLLAQAARRADAEPVTELLVAANLRDCTTAADLLVTAVERLVRQGGAQALAEDGDLQRFWRDVHAVAAHAALQPAAAAEAYARAVLGR
ncbi:acyl-CoA dehydrogenase family protein [Streptomyces sp. NPDC032472]|uniref:acyl-CoA dehydrogenase family protein n=1 Tax=Streptomyces sp. NPDC032472 TaxID=3155018 RepID=UPI0033DB211B